MFEIIKEFLKSIFLAKQNRIKAKIEDNLKLKNEINNLKKDI